MKCNYVVHDCACTFIFGFIILYLAGNDVIKLFNQSIYLHNQLYVYLGSLISYEFHIYVFKSPPYMYEFCDRYLSG